MFTLAPELSLLQAVLQTVRKFFPYLYLIIILLVSFAADQSGKRTLFDPGWSWSYARYGIREGRA